VKSKPIKKQQDVSSFYDPDLCLVDEDVSLFVFGSEELYSKEYIRWMNDVAVTKTLGRHDCQGSVDRAQLVEYFHGINKENTMFMAIYVKSGNQQEQRNKFSMKFVGTLKIYDIDFIAERASIGILVGDRVSWGKGIATKAIRAACGFVFDVLNLRKIVAGYIAGNIGMERAFLNNNFEVEAVFKEHLYYEGEFADHKFVCKFKN